jgi:hypothetical protein
LDIIIIIITFTRESPEGCRHASQIPVRGFARAGLDWHDGTLRGAPA